MSRGQLLEENKFYSLAIAEYQQANTQDPANIDPFIKIGRIHLLSNDYGKAEENFNKALTIEPTNTLRLFLSGIFKFLKLICGNDLSLLRPRDPEPHRTV